MADVNTWIYESRKGSNCFLFFLLMEVPYSASVQPIKQKLKKIKAKVKKIVKKFSAWFLALCQKNWGSGKKMIFLLKKTCI